MLKQIGVVTSPYGHYTLEYALSSIAAAGFRNVELWAASPHYCYADYTPQERQQRREEIAALLRQNGLSMPVLYPEQMNKYTLNIAAAAPHTKKFSMDRILEYIDDAQFWGGRSLCCWAPAGIIWTTRARRSISAAWPPSARRRSTPRSRASPC